MYSRLTLSPVEWVDSVTSKTVGHDITKRSRRSVSPRPPNEESNQQSLSPEGLDGETVIGVLCLVNRHLKEDL